MSKPAAIHWSDKAVVWLFAGIGVASLLAGHWKTAIACALLAVQKHRLNELEAIVESGKP